MANKIELKPAKPILKPHYTLSETFQRLKSLCTDIYSEQDLIDIALTGKLTIELMVTEQLILIPENSNTVSRYLSTGEQEYYKKQILSDVDQSLILVNNETDPDLYDFNFDPYVQLDSHIQTLLSSLNKRLVFSTEKPIYTLTNTKTYLTPSLVGNLVHFLNDNWLLFKPVTGLLIRAEQSGYARATIERIPFLSISDIGYELRRCDLPPFEIVHPETSEPLSLVGVVNDTPIQNAINARKLVITRQELARFEQHELGYNHGIKTTAPPKPSNNIVSYNETRAASLKAAPENVLAMYNELHVKNPNQTKNQLYQKLAKHFNLSVATIKRRLSAIK